MKTRFAGVLLAAAGLFGAAPAQAVTFGTPDGNGHPYVGTLLFQTESGFYSCSGTLMSPTVVLTAGHCTSEGGQPNLKTWVSFAATIDLASGCQGNVECFLTYMEGRPGWITATAHPHPAYNDFATWPATYDIGVVVLDEPVTMTTYGALPSLGFLDTIRPKTNRFTVVGYGMQGVVPGHYSDIWARYVGTVKLIELKSFFDAGMSAKYTNNAGVGGGTCYGDSGGPVFHQGSNVVTSVVSWGIAPCVGVSYEFRTDTTIAQDFLAGFGITP